MTLPNISWHALTILLQQGGEISKETIRDLVSNKVNYRDRKGELPITIAAKFGNRKVIGHLIAEGADEHATNIAGQTAQQLLEIYDSQHDNAAIAPAMSL